MAYRISGEFVCRRAGRESVLLNTRTGDYYGLNEVGVDCLELMDGVRGLDEVVQEIIKTYDAPREVIERDIDELVRSLLAHGILIDS